MNKPPLQKLIVGFLSLAVLTGSAFFAFTYSKNNRNTGVGAENTPNLSAFTPKKVSAPRDAELAALEMDQQNTATNNIADLLAQEVIKRNPSGPTGPDDNLTIAIPGNTDQLINDYLSSNPPSKELLETRFDITKIKVLGKGDLASETHYLSQIADLNNKIRLTEDDLQVAQAAANEDWVNDASNRLLDYVDQLAAVPVPAEMLSLHKALLNAALPLANYSVLLQKDPVAAAALTSDLDNILANKLSALTNASKKTNQALSLEEADTQISLLDKLNIIHTAHAQAAGVGVPTNDYVAIVQQYKDIIEKVAIGYLKNRLLKTLNTQVMKWVAGSGAPKFVTNWASFLGNAAAGAANQKLAAEYSSLCNSLGPNADLVAKALQVSGSKGSVIPSGGCKSEGAIQNVADFNADFRNGSWDSYIKAIQPQNNLLGALAIVSDSQRSAVAAAVDNAKNKALAGSGFTGTEVCDDGSAPLSGNDLQSLSAGDSSDLTAEDKVGDCLDGSTPHVTSPGKVTSDISSKSLGSAFDRIVAANDYTSLVQILAEVAITKFLKSDTKGLTGTANDTTAAKAAAAPGTTVDAQAKQMLDLKSGALADARGAQNALAQTVTILDETTTDCSDNAGVTSDASAEIAAIVPLQDELSQKIEVLKPQVDALQAFVNNLNGKTIADLTNQFGSFSAAQKEASDMSTKRDNAENTYIEANNLLASCSNTAPATQINGSPSTGGGTGDGSGDGTGDGTSGNP